MNIVIKELPQDELRFLDVLGVILNQMGTIEKIIKFGNKKWAFST